MSAVVDRVVAIVSEQLEIDPQEISCDSPFATDLGADSLDQYNMMIAFEKAFNIKFAPDVAEQVQSIGEVVALIETARAA